MVLNRSNPGAQFLPLMIASRTRDVCPNMQHFRKGARMVQEGKLCSHLSVLYQHLRICFFWGGPKYSRGWGDFSRIFKRSEVLQDE